MAGAVAGVGGFLLLCGIIGWLLYHRKRAPNAVVEGPPAQIPYMEEKNLAMNPALTVDTISPAVPVRQTFVVMS